MGKNGYKFEVDEIVTLGNPVEKIGLSLADVMKLNGISFNDIESRRLGTDWNMLNFTSFSLDDEQYAKRVNHKNCMICGHVMVVKDNDFSAALMTIMKQCAMPCLTKSKVWFCNNCRWWYTIESVLDNEFDFPPYTHFVMGNGVEKIRSKQEPTQPWIEILSHPELYLATGGVYRTINPNW